MARHIWPLNCTLSHKMLFQLTLSQAPALLFSVPSARCSWVTEAKPVSSCFRAFSVQGLLQSWATSDAGNMIRVSAKALGERKTDVCTVQLLTLHSSERERSARVSPSSPGSCWLIPSPLQETLLSSDLCCWQLGYPAMHSQSRSPQNRSP